MTSFYFEGGWYKNLAMGCIEYIPAGVYSEGNPQRKCTIRLRTYEYNQLLKFIAENETGIIKTDRAEDLKIIHRLLDIAETGAKKQ